MTSRRALPKDDGVEEDEYVMQQLEQRSRQVHGSERLDEGHQDHGLVHSLLALLNLEEAQKLKRIIHWAQENKRRHFPSY